MMPGAEFARRLERSGPIQWIDKNFAGWPYATNWHWIIWCVPLLPLMWLDWTTLTISAAVAWSVLWWGIVGWRAMAWFRKIEGTMMRRKKRRS